MNGNLNFNVLVRLPTLGFDICHGLKLQIFGDGVQCPKDSHDV